MPVLGSKTYDSVPPDALRIAPPKAMTDESPDGEAEKLTEGAEKLKDQETKSLCARIPLSVSVTIVPVTVTGTPAVCCRLVSMNVPTIWKEIFQVKSVMGDLRSPVCPSIAKKFCCGLESAFRNL
jgi:hypothetical protein